MAAPLLLRAIPVLRHRFTHRNSAVRFLTWTAASSLLRGANHRCPPQDNLSNNNNTNGGGGGGRSMTTETSAAFGSDKDTLAAKFSKWEDSPDYRQWKDREAEILRDIEPIIFLTKEILHTDRYENGECLSDEDEKPVVEKLLSYHPHSEDKIGCGLQSIMVDRHPQFTRSRCLFVVREDGSWIDFSYQKCLRAYIRDKYPSHAERFIREHFKRGRD